MNCFFIRTTLAVAAAIIGTSHVQAQIPPASIRQPHAPPAAYSGTGNQPYTFAAPTPADAYREGLINRWELERLEGPLPAAFQGPSVDGTRGVDGGGGGRD